MKAKALLLFNVYAAMYDLFIVLIIIMNLLVDNSFIILLLYFIYFCTQ